MRYFIYRLLSPSTHRYDLSWWVDLLIIVLILFNTMAVVAESEPAIAARYGALLSGFEWFSVSVFALEYVLRLWTANEQPGYQKPLSGNLKWALTPMALIDLLAFLPSLLLFTGSDLRLLRMVRMLRLFRLFKIARYHSAMHLIQRVLNAKREELVISVILAAFLLLITSTLMYHVENEAQPEAFSSIPKTMWWGIATLTTVGYGDIYPVTPLGRVLGGVISILGIGLFALPTGILASGFSDALAHRRKSKDVCPHCGAVHVE